MSSRQTRSPGGRARVSDWQLLGLLVVGVWRTGVCPAVGTARGMCSAMRRHVPAGRLLHALAQRWPTEHGGPRASPFRFPPESMPARDPVPSREVTCVACNGEIESALARLGSVSCSHCR